MRKRKLRLALAILLLAVIGGLTWMAVSLYQPPEPVFEGKRLSEWLYKNPSYQTHEAVRQIGTNAIPTLLRMLRAHDSGIKLKLVGLAQKQHFIPVNFIKAERQNWDAVQGFSILGDTASNAVPGLIQVFEEKISKTSRRATAAALGGIGPAASAAAPALLRAVGDIHADVDVRLNAADALLEIHAQPELIVPVLINCLKESEPAARLVGTGALRSLGSAAKPAVPALLDLLKDPDIGVKSEAEQALKSIDPEAAAKAGIK